MQKRRHGALKLQQRERVFPLQWLVFVDHVKQQQWYLALERLYLLALAGAGAVAATPS